MPVLFPFERPVEYDFHDEQNRSLEAEVMESVANEAIQIFGIEVVYMPFTITDLDKVFGEDRALLFNNAYKIRMATDAIGDFGNHELIFNKFGIHEMVETGFQVVKKTFADIIGRDPAHGDLIYWPNAQMIYQVTYFEEHDTPFIQMGRAFVWHLYAKITEYSYEELKTGNAIVDGYDPANLPDGTVIPHSGSDHDTIDREELGVVEFDPNDPFRTLR